MQSKVISIGHINPDTDSVLSAILVSKFGKEIFGFAITPAIASDINNETKYVLSLLRIPKPAQISKITDEMVVLVDTTEPKQILEGLTDVNLAGIIDHHNLGGLKSGKPILARIEPLGCTAAVIYKILREKNIEIDKTAAILMIACIVSDTLNLTSPTTSPDDKKILGELNKISVIDLEKFVDDLFAAKSSLEGISTEDIITKDYKNFEMGKNKVGIAVWETTNPETVNSKKNDLMGALAKRKTAENLDYIFFLVVDIFKESSDMYIVGEPEKVLAEKVFGVKTENDTLELKGVVSRKKQVVPPLMKELAK
jgi:manganese-dependent inorganic pyrophosphatase